MGTAQIVVRPHDVACGASRSSSRITVEHGDMCNLRLADQPFDQVVAGP